MTRRLLLVVLLGSVTVIASPAFGQEQEPDAGGPIVVAGVKGPLDQRAIDFLIGAVATPDAQAVVLQVDNPGVASGDAQALAAAIESASVPVVVWIGPSGAEAYGFVLTGVVAAADYAAAAPGARVGYAAADGGDGPSPVGLADLADRATVVDAPLPPIVVAVVPTIGQLIASLDGLTLDSVTLETATTTRLADGSEVTQLAVDVRFLKPSLLTRFLRLAIRPEATFFFLMAGLALVAFEFYAAGVGVSAALASLALLLAGYGLAVLPINWLAVGAGLGGLGAYNWDFQRSTLGLRSAAGTVLLLASGLSITSAEPLYGPRWWAVVLIVIGVAVFYLFAMTTVVRSRFATPTIGREHLIGKRGTAVSTLDPGGVVTVEGARWRATGHRAAGISAGDEIEVVSVAGITLEVAAVRSEAP